MNLGCADGLDADTLLLLLHLVATESLRVAVFETRLSGGLGLACRLEAGKPSPLGKVMAPLSMREAIGEA